MKYIKKIVLILLLITWLIFSVEAQRIDFPEDTDVISGVSLDMNNNWNIVENINKTWVEALTTIKTIFQWVLLIYIVFIWIQMITSMWDNEEQLSKAKNQIWYTMVALVFINIPWTIYYALRKDDYWNLGWWWTAWSSESWNIFVNNFLFKSLNENIVWFMEIWVWTYALVMIIYSGIMIMNSRWKEDRISESKNKIIWSTIALMFIWFIETYKRVVFDWNIEDWAEMFDTLANLALFFAWPTAIFFITLAAYYYITSNGDEERTKKAKSIIVNTLIATVLLLASYSFLLDLAKF